MSNLKQNECCHVLEKCLVKGNSYNDLQLNRFWRQGYSFPLGSSIQEGGVNFSVFSTCDLLELLLFDNPTAPGPSKVIALDPELNKTCHYWHIFVPELKCGQVYAYRPRY